MDDEDDARTDASGRADGGKPGSGEPRQQVTNYNIFHHRLDSERVNFGIANEADSRRSRTGSLSESDVRATLKVYLRPKPFAEALKTLRARHVVVLSGADGLGKRAGAIALLDAADTKGAPVGLPPTARLSEISQHSFRDGKAYLVQDHIADGEESRSAAHEMQQLEQALTRVGAFLAMTTASPASSLPRELVKSWQPPDPLKLLAEMLARSGHELEGPVAERVRERFAACRTPRDIVEFAARLVADEEPDAMARALEASESSSVSAWFERNPSQEAILFVTALAFLHAMPERRFEESRARLEHRVRDAQVRALGDGVERKLAAEPKLQPERERRLREVPLAMRDEAHKGREGVIAFETSLYRRWVLAELWKRYGRDLWTPVREWLGELVEDADENEILSISAGLALLGHAAPEEMLSSYLGGWAAGTPAQQAVACYAAWFASVSDELGPAVLGAVIAWARDRDERRVATAIVCLSGELGLRYPGEAIRWLWHLERKSKRDRQHATNALVDLFLAGVVAGEGALRVPVSLLARVEREPLHGPAGAPRDRLLSIAGRLLQVRVSGGQPAVATLLVHESEAAVTLGALWATCLHNSRHRGKALTALRDTVRSLSNEEGARDIVGRLGKQITSRLSPTEISMLERDLFHLLMRRRDTDEQRAKSIVEVLLESRVDSSTDTRKAKV